MNSSYKFVQQKQYISNVQEHVYVKARGGGGIKVRIGFFFK